MAQDAGGIDYSTIPTMSQEDLNRRLFAAMMAQGSGRYDQMMLADTLKRSQGPVPLGPRGRGIVGEMNDAMTAYRPGAERQQAMEMVKQLRARDMTTMQKILGAGQAAQGGGAAGPAVPNAPPEVGPIDNPPPLQPGVNKLGMPVPEQPFTNLKAPGTPPAPKREEDYGNYWNPDAY